MERLVKIQTALRAPKDKESGESKRKFKYRSAEDILEAVKPLLAETETAVTLEDSVSLIGTRYFLCSEATLRGKDGSIASSRGWAEFDTHEVEDKYNGGGLKKTMSNEQATGCASSYARKYALCGLFAIDNDENDPDRTEITPGQKQHPKPAPAAPKPAPQPQQTFDDSYYSLCADIDAATNVQQCRATATMAIGQPYEHLIRKKACSRGMQIAASLDELKLAYEIVKDHEGWQEAKNEYVRIATEKGWAK